VLSLFEQISRNLRILANKRFSKRTLKFARRYSTQLSFAVLLAVFLTVTVGEGQAYDTGSIKLAAQVDLGNSNFIGKPQILGDQTVTTGAVQQQVAIVYQVGNGDTVTSIAQRYDLSPGTILDANNINPVNATSIQPGQQLLIPAVDTDTSTAWLSTINTYEQQQQAAAAAQATANAAAAAKAKAKTTKSTISGLTNAGTMVNGVLDLGREYGSYNGGVPGQCTWYVNSVRSFPGPMGNGGQYLSSARSYGLATGSTPRVGAVVVTSESYYGHVAIVVGVSGGTITIKEMNYLGQYIVDERSMSANSGYIKGYIY
jgi:surface antigen